MPYKGARGNFGVMKIFYIAVRVAQLYVFVKTLELYTYKKVNATVYRLYLNKAD